MKPDDCESIDELYKNAKECNFDCCQNCPINIHELKGGESVFASGCDKNHQTDKSPLILFVLRDPSIPQNKSVQGCTDGNVCGWCHDDQSAQNFTKALFPKLGTEGVNGRYPVYCINAVLHGSKKNEKPPKDAFNACSSIMKTYVRLLQPKLVIALGVDARNSIRRTFNLEQFERATAPMASPLVDSNTKFWWAFHPAPQSFNNKKDLIIKRFEKIGRYLKHGG